jgi:hypothetical protein
LDEDYKFGLIELDEHHVMIPGRDDKIITLIQEKFDAFLEENSFQPDILDQQFLKNFDEATESTSTKSSGKKKRK